MKTGLALIVGVLCLRAWSCGGAECTNKFAIYLVADQIPQENIFRSTLKPEELKLAPQPLISDPDLISYNTNNHSFVVKPAAAARVTKACERRLQTPFVLLACDQPVYAGTFTSPFSSFSSELPTIMLGLWETNEVSGNVTLKIDRAYPGPSNLSPPDRRSDPRVLSALRQLFPGKS